MTSCTDTDLMQNGGHITGWFLPNGPETEAIEAGLEALCDRETFNKRSTAARTHRRCCRMQ